MKKIVFLILMLFSISLICCACGDTPPVNEGGTDNPGNGNEGNEQEPIFYTVTWKDEAGNILKTESIEEGKTPSYSYQPESDAEWKRSFAGWSTSENGEIASIGPVNADIAYYAIISSTKQVYTVSFNTGYELTVTPQSVEYGKTATAPEIGKREGYRFIGWYSDEALTKVADFTVAVSGSITYYAAWEEVPNIVELLKTLLGSFKLDPYSYIPDTMKPSYSGKLISQTDVVSDYSNNVNISSIPSAGFGEQWDMINENIEQSELFFNVLSVIEGISTTSISIFSNYFDENPADTAHHSFTSGIYSVTINYTEPVLSYVVDYTATFPALGQQSVQIALVMDSQTGVKTVRVQLGDANALIYTLGENYYEFAVKYLGVRRAYFLIRENNGAVDGHIYEFLTAGGVETSSAADFYITDKYVSAVGNKASGITGFTGYISELYDVSNGKLIGYEVQETLSALTYNTLWLDLASVSGINSIKYLPKTDTTEAKIFVNGSNEEWTAKKVGGLSGKMLSRRFDIEFRTQYFYSYDSENDKYVKIKASVPMFFVQEENYETLAADVNSENGINVSVSLESSDLQKLMNDYDTLIEVFITNKEEVTVDGILELIGSKIIFTE